LTFGGVRAEYESRFISAVKRIIVRVFRDGTDLRCDVAPLCTGALYDDDDGVVGMLIELGLHSDTTSRSLGDRFKHDTSAPIVGRRSQLIAETDSSNAAVGVGSRYA
jgi:hypothetical protein